MEEYFREYGVLAIFLMVAVTVPIGMLGLSRLAQFIRVRPSRSTKVKRTSYESGLRPFSPRPKLFNMRYYNFAILFVVFDVETVLLFPWAVRYGLLSQRFGWLAFGAMMVFIFVVTVAFLYAWRKGALNLSRDSST